MRFTFLASVLAVAGAGAAGAQAANREYRPEIIVTSPRLRGYGAQLLVEQHLAMGTLAPNERILGVGVVSPVFLHLRAALEARQVMRPTELEFRYKTTLMNRSECSSVTSVQAKS